MYMYMYAFDDFLRRIRNNEECVLYLTYHEDSFVHLFMSNRSGVVLFFALLFYCLQCRLSHNNVCRDSVVVAGSDRTWRLAGFALASKFESTSSLVRSVFLAVSLG